MREKIAREKNLDMEADSWLIGEYLRAWRENKPCENCKGVCKKSSFQYKQFTVYSEEIPMRSGLVREDIRTGVMLCKWGKRRKAQQFAEESGIPGMYASKSFEDYQLTKDNERAVGLAYAFLDGDVEGLYLYGGCGTGKTFLASLIASEYALQAKKVKFREVPALLNKLKKSFDDKTINADAILNECINCELLVLDDFGLMDKVSEWAVSILYQLINGRYKAGKKIIVTSNYHMKDLAVRLETGDAFSAERIVSRLAAMCREGYLGEKDRRLL